MQISFDVDDTLICYHTDALYEPNQVPWLLRLWFPEPLRLGTRELMQQLIKNGWKIAIYTTSYRSPKYLRWFLRFYGIRVGLVVNQTIHNKVVRQEGSIDGPSKLPSRFHIDLHVDDLEGVEMEGQQYGFDVVVVRPEDTDWVNRVLEAAGRVKKRITDNLK